MGILRAIAALGMGTVVAALPCDASEEEVVLTVLLVAESEACPPDGYGDADGTDCPRLGRDKLRVFSTRPQQRFTLRKTALESDKDEDGRLIRAAPTVQTLDLGRTMIVGLDAMFDADGGAAIFWFSWSEPVEAEIRLVREPGSPPAFADTDRIEGNNFWISHAGFRGLMPAENATWGLMLGDRHFRFRVRAAQPATAAGPSRSGR